MAKRRGEPTLADTIKGEYYYGMGRRKTAVARVRLFPNGEGSIIVNGKNAATYFGQRDGGTLSGGQVIGESGRHLATIVAPLRLLELGNAYNLTVRVAGGGVSGQAGAIRHALARALLKINPDWKPMLRKAGYLTRDPRMKERKKPGLKRARKAPQYTKR
jgi:small subunit ribosomal protein S9